MKAAAQRVAQDSRKLVWIVSCCGLLLVGGARAAESPPTSPKSAASKKGSASAKPASRPSTKAGTPPDTAAVAELPEPPPPPPLFKWDVPGALEQIPIPGEQEALGLPTRMHAVRSSRSVEELILHFRQSFRDAQLYIPPAELVAVPMQEPSVTALDPVRMLSFMAILHENPDRTVTVVLTETNLAKRQKVQTFAPLFPGGERPLTSSTEGLRSLFYTVKAKEKDVQAFYRRELKKLGFAEVEPLKFQKGRDVWWVQLAQDGEITSVSVIDSTQVPVSSPTHVK